MITQQTNQDHNVDAWYFAPIYPDNTDNTKRNKLTWVDNPIPFKCAFGQLTKTGFNIIPNYSVSTSGSTIITESTIKFDNEGKIGFGRNIPKKEDASKITKDGISTTPTKRSKLLGTRFVEVHDSKVIKVG